MGSPALTVPWSAVLVIVMLAQLTVIGTGPMVGLPSLLVVALALLSTVPQVAAVVGEVIWTWTEPEGARSPRPNSRTPPAMAQVPGGPPAAMLQLSPELVGRVSESV